VPTASPSGCSTPQADDVACGAAPGGKADLEATVNAIDANTDRFTMFFTYGLHNRVDLSVTGLRIHVGHMRKPPKRRAWRKLHLVVDADTGEIVASDLTGRRTPDCARVPALIEQLEDPVASVSADGAYDTAGVYEAAQMKGNGHAVRVLIPPGRNARLSPKPSAAQRERNRTTSRGPVSDQDPQHDDQSRYA